MSDKTGIEWTSTTNADGSVTPGATWNPAVKGCSMVSPGCENCYAMKFAHRLSGPGQRYEGLTKLGAHGPRWTGKVRISNDNLDAPLHWKRPRRVFVNSMTDLFHKDVPNETIAAVFGVMAACPQHTFQILTKRAERLPALFRWFERRGEDGRQIFPDDPLDWRIRQMLNVAARRVGADVPPNHGGPWPLPNVHLGVSAENQETADERIPHLLAARAAVSFVSAEPLLGPIDLNRIDATKAGWSAVNGFDEPTAISAFGKWQETPMRARLQNGIDWVIVGSESGPGARPMAIDWARSIVDQCTTAGVAVFVKQIATKAGREAGDRKGGDPTLWPIGRWPREFPTPSRPTTEETQR